MLNYLAGFGAWVQVIQGCMFIACVLFLRKGVVGTLWPYLYRLKFLASKGAGAVPLNPSLATLTKEK